MRTRVRICPVSMPWHAWSLSHGALLRTRWRLAVNAREQRMSGRRVTPDLGINLFRNNDRLVLFYQHQRMP